MNRVSLEWLSDSPVVKEFSVYIRQISKNQGDQKQELLEKLEFVMYDHDHSQAGHLPLTDITQLALAYCTVFSVGVDTGHIRQAVNIARS